jgi:hypothetical protein
MIFDYCFLQMFFFFEMAKEIIILKRTKERNKVQGVLYPQQREKVHKSTKT